LSGDYSTKDLALMAKRFEETVRTVKKTSRKTALNSNSLTKNPKPILNLIQDQCPANCSLELPFWWLHPVLGTYLENPDIPLDLIIPDSEDDILFIRSQSYEI
jgi:hypothetical protein